MPSPELRVWVSRQSELISRKDLHWRTEPTLGRRPRRYDFLKTLERVSGQIERKSERLAAGKFASRQTAEAAVYPTVADRRRWYPPVSGNDPTLYRPYAIMKAWTSQRLAQHQPWWRVVSYAATRKLRVPSKSTTVMAIPPATRTASLRCTVGDRVTKGRCALVEQPAAPRPTAF